MACSILWSFERKLQIKPGQRVAVPECAVWIRADNNVWRSLSRLARTQSSAL